MNSLLKALLGFAGLCVMEGHPAVAQPSPTSRPAATSTVTIQRGELSVVFRDNTESPATLSGVAQLFNRKDAPTFNAFDTDTPGASAGLNFEHIIGGHKDDHNAFSPRQGRYTMTALPDGESVILERRAEDDPWGIESTMKYTVLAPHYIDLTFRCTPRETARFGRRDYAIFFWANYMNDVLDSALHFRGIARHGAEESWISGDTPKGPANWDTGGTYRNVSASPLEYDSDHNLKLNVWSYDEPRFSLPFYYGRAAHDMVFIVMFDRAYTPEDEIRFSLFKFKLKKFPRPAWDFQYVIHHIEAGRQYGYNARVVWKKFVSPEDCLHEYEEWRRAEQSAQDSSATVTQTQPAGHVNGAAESKWPSVSELPSHLEMPDPLVSNNGQRITTVQQWNERREELKQVIRHYLTGTPPPPPGIVRGRVLDSRLLLDGTVKFKRVHLSFGPEEKLGFDAAIFVPAKGAGPFPTIIQPSFFTTPGGPIPPLPGNPSHLSAKMVERRKKFVQMADAEFAAQSYAEALNRGYAIMTFYYQQCGADDRDWQKSGFFSAYPDCDWADLASWAWSMSRCVDYLETQPFADKNALIALGHSRLGKTALVAGAFDERFALVAPAGSGCGGTGVFRFNGEGRGGKEGLENVVAKFPQWVSPRLLQFSGQVDKLPFDQHWLIALVAPRAFIAADGLDDPATNGKALKQSYLAAKPVFDFLGAPNRLGIHFRPGQHELAPEDWKAILDFADQELRGMKVERRFDHIPPDEQLH